MIPKTMFRIVPAKRDPIYDEYWAKWKELHPGWKFISKSDKPDPENFPILGHLFEKCMFPVQIADLKRLELVYSKGGVYVDMDFEPIRNIDKWLDNPMFIGREDSVHISTGMFGAEVHHPFLREAMERVSRVNFSYVKTLGPALTGITNVNEAFKDYQGNDITLLAGELLYPYHWRAKTAYENTPAESFTRSYAVHRWANSWKDWNKNSNAGVPNINRS